MGNADYHHFMEKVLALALKGVGKVAPNPLVGALLLQNGTIIGEGAHLAVGEAHAEVHAVRDAESKGFNVAGATLVCNLEPCCHQAKRTPPCAPLILEKKIQKVVIANLDPNPLVAGKGVELLRQHGVEVLVGIGAAAGRQLNRVFFHNMENQLPYIHLKWAQSFDGAVSTGISAGPERWLSDEAAREEVHYLRFCYDAIMVGRNTINMDNPQLDIRMGYQQYGKQNYKIVIGRWDQIGQQTHFWALPDPKKIIFSPPSPIDTPVTPFLILPLPQIGQGELDYRMLLQQIYQLKITSVLVEGGPKLLAGFLRSQLWQQLTIYLCPKIIGNRNYAFQQASDPLNNLPMIDLSACQISYRQLNQQLVVEASNSCLPA